MEQHFPFGQLPQTVLSLPAPQEPSIVTRAVACVPGAMDVEAPPITGSPVEVDVDVGSGPAESEQPL